MNVQWVGRSLRVIGANVLNYDIVVSEFELQSYYYVHFLTNSLGKRMDSLTPQLQV